MKRGLIMKKKLLKVFSVLLSGLMVFNMLVVPTPVKAQEFGTYAYEDVTLSATINCGSYGSVKCTAYTRYTSLTQKYIFLRYTYENRLNSGVTIKSVTCNYDNGDTITDNIVFTVKVTNGVGNTGTFTGSIQMN